MIAFTESQLKLLDIFLKQFEIKDAIRQFDDFNRTYKKPVKKRPPLASEIRCHALKKDHSRCNGRKIGKGKLCGIHIARGIPYGLFRDPVSDDQPVASGLDGLADQVF
jgi:hypothetical protein